MVEVRIVSNPALQNILLELRNRSTRAPRFCELLEKAGFILAYEVAGELPLVEDSVVTPLGAEARARRVRDEDLVIVAVLRAALPMALGARRLYERARLGFVAAKRVESTRRLIGDRIVFDIETPYWSISDTRDKHVILVDPMLATGSTLSRIVKRIAENGPAKIIVMSLIATRPGINSVEEAAREAGIRLTIYAGSIDPRLNDEGFIVPGLGDAGDRCFG